MTVEELITRLAQYPGDRKVYFKSQYGHTQQVREVDTDVEIRLVRPADRTPIVVLR